MARGRAARIERVSGEGSVGRQLGRKRSIFHRLVFQPSMAGGEPHHVLVRHRPGPLAALATKRAEVSRLLVPEAAYGGVMTVRVALACDSRARGGGRTAATRVDRRLIKHEERARWGGVGESLRDLGDR